MGLPITGQHYNLVSAAFYIGFLVWEFPTQYIAQRLRIAKYLGEYHISYLGQELTTTPRLQRLPLGNDPDDASGHSPVRSILRPPVYNGYVTWERRTIVVNGLAIFNRHVGVVRCTDFDPFNWNVLQERRTSQSF